MPHSAEEFTYVKKLELHRFYPKYLHGEVVSAKNKSSFLSGATTSLVGIYLLCIFPKKQSLFDDWIFIIPPILGYSPTSLMY